MPSERSHMAELFGGDSSVDDADMDLFGGNVVGHALLLETNQEVTRSNSNNNSAATTMPVDGAEPEEPLEVRHKRMYPLADAPLPTQWSSKDKYTYIGLSDDGLTVQYKGHGKDHMDAASVRADHPIPASCGLYYFEVKIISKGRDGYFGIGLSGESVSLNRLPGWDKMSYGYHGDDGHSFCSSGTGKPYGPTFSTGDVIGCGVNLVDNSCFYTKNGINLGTAFTDLPPYLYPTVGLQTPGEVLEANFGQRKFVYDIEDDMHGLRAKTHGAIRNFPIANDRGQWNTMLQKMVLMYLMHHGYVGAAEAFAKATGQAFEEEIASVKNRQRIQRMVLEGRISEAIQTTAALYPGLLESKPDLLFMLKTRQFIEMIGGCEPEIGGNGSCPPLPPKVYMCPDYPMKKKKKRSRSARDSSSGSNSVPCPTPETDVEMMDCGDKESSSDSDSEAKRNGLGKCNGAYLRNGVPFGFPNPPIFAKKDVLNKTLAFGRELKHLSMKMRQECGRNETNKKMLEEACSLLAYVNPWDCPLSYLLDPTQRDPVCRALNSAIMERLRLPPHPSLEVAVCQANQLLRTMASVGMGACAFASLPDVLKD